MVAGSERLLSAALAAALAGGLAACGPSPTAPPPRYVEVVPVPADRVVERCACDDDDDETFVARPVAYVPIDAWEPPPSVKRFEAEVPPRGAEPPSYVQFPQLTLHESIGETSIARRGRWRR
jgi:hypothetical protein